MRYKLGSIKKIIKEWGIVTLIYAPFVYLILYFFSNSFLNIYKTEIARNWIPVAAEIKLVSFNLERLYSNIHDEYVSNINVVTKYSYKINNKIISGNKIAFGYDEESFDDDVDMEIFNKLENCKLVMIYVNPNNENEYVISPGLNNSIFRNLIYTLMWCTFISLFIIPKSLKQNNMLKPFFKIYYFIVLILWIIGIFPFLTRSLNFNVKENIKIIEGKVINPVY